MVAGTRQGQAINQSCVTMLSAVLQAYVEEVFLWSSKRLFKTLRGDEVIKRYERTYFQWGNPNPENISRLFQRLGIDDVFEGLSWKKCPKSTIAKKLQDINKLRNQIAHGNAPDVSLSQVSSFRNFAHQFGQRFAKHVRKKLPK